MIKIENTSVFNIVRAVYSARNPMNSWDRSDSDPSTDTLGENDLKLAKTLANAGRDHGKFLRMIHVTADVTAPLYWWKEFSTYKVGTVANSCSTMHKIHEKEFTVDDFSIEHLIDEPLDFSDYCEHSELLKTDKEFSAFYYGADSYLAGLDFRDTFVNTIDLLNNARFMYLKTKNKRYWWQMIQMLPSSYNQRRTVDLNYEVLRNMYHARKNHKLDEWHTFCDWIKTLPYCELITGEEIDHEEN